MTCLTINVRMLLKLYYMTKDSNRKHIVKLRHLIQWRKHYYLSYDRDHLLAKERETSFRRYISSLA
jgi:hypothetical protein